MESERESQEPREEVTVNESLFGIMGEYGNNLMIYSSDSIILKHQIAVGAIIRSFQFTKVDCQKGQKGSPAIQL